MIKERSRYHFVYQSILTQIEQGELSPGDSLPTARQLCQQYGVGITTIRRVLRMPLSLRQPCGWLGSPPSGACCACCRPARPSPACRGGLRW